MKRGEIYTSGWLKAKDMLDAGRVNGLDLTIVKAEAGELDGDKQCVLSFREDERQLGLNATNFDAIVDMTGHPDSDDWIGTTINAYPAKLDRPYNGHTHGVRVRGPQGVGPAKSTAAASMMAPDVGRPVNASLNRSIGTAVGAASAPVVSPARAALDAFIKAQPPGTTEEEAKVLLKADLRRRFPGVQPAALTPAQWNLVEAAFAGYQGEPTAAIPADDDIPF
jgi:hypothetical protein